MPIYEYDCQTCKHPVEVLLNRADETPECPDCGGEKLTRLLSVPATPSVRSGSGSLPVAAESCAAPRCCGGGCQ
ncbi:Zinc ribbon domain protein [Roseimaritima multifibrata]|uniref:Zinc ribbon domain protein n=1 Tax=Roseimaritima multifibrata TaxID=1930274 RepID=A0A517MJE0_9BACT|nr:zinc ribbon domain-containing protein [Roseimaritima multifibrata]QDS95016.1 Zinc ribbon domain protein [Roseimaritima multifibrata]